MDFQNITKEDIAKAIQYIEINNVPAKHNSSVNDLIVNGHKYPPKYVLAVAKHLATGTNIDSTEFTSNEAVRFLQGLDYQIEKREELDDFNKFKRLLEYFTAHLEYMQSENSSSIGYKDYINELVINGTFVKTGSKNIQNQIKNWSTFSDGSQITININGFAWNKYASDLNYLNWKDSWYNVRAKWDEQKHSVIGFYFTKDSDHNQTGNEYEITKLSLYDYDEPNDFLKQMYLDFKKLKNATEDSMSNENRNENIKTLLLNNHNIILHGAPGTGKTYLAKDIVIDLIFEDENDRKLIRKKDEEIQADEKEKYQILNTQLNEQYCFVQFHQSYDYTDFVEGLRPINQTDNQIGFERKDGVFKAFCEKALTEDKSNIPFIFIIDEINRGEMSKIFGELFFSIDPGYRGKKGNIKTQYANLQEEPNAFDLALGINKNEAEKDGKKVDINKGKYGHFFVPENIYIIGTMNDIDRSVESMDFAMRRRFAFKEITAAQSQESMFGDAEKWKKSTEKNIDDEILNKLKNRMDNLNKVILDEKYHLGQAYQIGGAYFLKFAKYYDESKDEKDAFNKLWDNHIAGVIKEYLRGIDDKNETLFKELEKAYQNDSEKKATKPAEGVGGDGANAGTGDSGEN